MHPSVEPMPPLVAVVIYRWEDGDSAVVNRSKSILFFRACFEESNSGHRSAPTGILCGYRHPLRPNYFNAQKINDASGVRPDRLRRGSESAASLHDRHALSDICDRSQEGDPLFGAFFSDPKR
ncbi:hypothetical protein OPV22_018413 [Ensete ventricosum]|uniref:Uncharacterized protein n=1 Tax=Ensete ventricosum TaxID=4639 RepID=A0AAV8R4H0_ENSVE|nr:hypothetical protein OPV22_018413 [Ensete ventricosum]